MNYVIASAARRDLDSVAAFYNEVRPGLGLGFIEEVQRIVRLLQAHPDLGQKAGRQHRRISLTGFPSFLNYRFDQEASLIRIIAVSHQKHRPDYWVGHVEEPAPLYRVKAAV